MGVVHRRDPRSGGDDASRRPNGRSAAPSPIGTGRADRSTTGRPPVVSSRSRREPRADDDPDLAQPDHDPGQPVARRARCRSSSRPARSCPAAPAAPAPLRREGPAKLTGAAKYADDLVFPGAWYGATIRSTDAARPVRSALDLDPAFDWSTVVVVTAADIPGENIVSLDQATTSRSSSRSAARSSTTPSRSRSSPRPTARRSARARRARHAPDRAAARRSSTRSTQRPRLRRTTRSRPATSTPAFAAADLVLEGEYRVGHQEQLYIENNAMIAVPREDGGVDRPRLAPVPVLHPQGAEARRSAIDDRQARVVQAETGGGFGGKEEYPSIDRAPRRAPRAARPGGRSG